MILISKWFFRELKIIFLNWFSLRELFSLLFQSIRAGYKQGESSAGEDAGDKISEPSLFRDKIQSSHHPLPTHPIHRHRAQGAGAVLSWIYLGEQVVVSLSYWREDDRGRENFNASLSG